MVIAFVLLKDFEIFIWLDPFTMVSVNNVTMVTILMLYTYHFQCLCSCSLDPVIQLNFKILIPTSS